MYRIRVYNGAGNMSWNVKSAEYVLFGCPGLEQKRTAAVIKLVKVHRWLKVGPLCPVDDPDGHIGFEYVLVRVRSAFWWSAISPLG